MKKLFTLFVAVFAMAFCANAQIYLLQEDFESYQTEDVPNGWINIDADGDGYAWYVTRNNEQVNFNCNGEACLTSASWLGDPLYPDNYIITPAVTLTGDAILSFYIGAQDPDYANEDYQVLLSTTGTAVSDFTTVLTEGTTNYDLTNVTVNLSAYTGQTVYIAFRHYNTSDEFRINLDDVEVFVIPTEPTLNVNPTTLNFGNVAFPGDKVMTANISCYSLTSGITATATAPFTVSADGTNFAATATVSQNGGPLYVKFSPTAAGVVSSTISVTSGSLSQSIAVTGTGFDCSQALSLPFTEDFESGAFPPQCWSLISNNAKTWAQYTDNSGNNWAYCTYDIEDQNEQLITPTLNFQNYVNASLKFDFNTSYYYLHDGDGTGEQHNLLIYASTDNGATFSSTALYDMREDEAEFTTYQTTSTTVDLSSLIGQPNVKLMFAYVASYGAELLIDNIEITGTVGIADVNNDTRIYPNPAVNTINVEAASSINHIEIFNMNGQKLSDIQVDGNNTTVNVSNFANGIYLMNIHTDNGVSHQKITVVK